MNPIIPLFQHSITPLRTLLGAVYSLALLLPSHAAERPNILFAISDDQSWPHASAYGTTWVKDPGFDRVARGGLLFNNAYTPNAKCSPSRACILTGRNTWQLEEACNHMPFFPEKFKTWMEALKEHGGYTTGHTAKGWAPGVAKYADGKPRELTGKGWNAKKAVPPAKGISGNDYAANFADFLEATPADRPWAFWYGATEPHRGYEFSSGAKYGGKKTSDIDKVPAFWPDNETVRNDMLDYAFEIEHFDNHLARMLDLLEKRGALDNTLVVVTADNGMPFPRIKGQEYELSNHLPLAVMWRNGIAKPGRKIDDYVSFIDFAPTFLEVAGVPYPRAGSEADGASESSVTLVAAITGRSLSHFFDPAMMAGAPPWRDHVVFGKERHDTGRPNDWGYPVRGIVKDGFLYLENFETDRWPSGNPETGYLNCDGSPTKTEILNLRRSGENTAFWQQAFGKRPAEEFFHISKDIECVDNLAANPEDEARKDALRKQLIAELEEQKDPRALGNGKIFDEYPVSTTAADYYERWKAGENPKAGWVNPGDYEKEPVE